MADDEATQRLRELEDKLNQARMMSPRGPAGAFADPIPVADMPPVLEPPARPGFKQGAAEFGAKAYTTMKGATLGARAAAPLASRVRNPLGAAAIIGAGAAAGAGVAGYGTELSLQGIKKVMGAPGAPDSVSEAFSSAGEEFWNSALGETWGRVLFGAPQTMLMPYRRAVTPESYAQMQELSNRIRGAYEKIGGSPLLEDTRSRWNPGRLMTKRGTELDNAAVVKRLRDAGLDPQKAREVALTGGLKPSELDSRVTGRFWAQSNASKLKPDEAYERTSARLLQASAMEDFGVNFARSLPPEDLGRALHAAVWGRFDTLNSARTRAMNTLADKLPADMKLDMTAFKKTMGISPQVKLGGVNFRAPTPGSAQRHPAFDIAWNLPDSATFKDVENARTAIATLMRDERILQSPSDRAALGNLLKQFDDHTATALPSGLKRDFRRFAREDNELNKGLLDGAFVSGLLQHKPTMRAFADEIIDNTDVDSFRQLEKVLQKQPDAARNIGSLKSAIAEKFMAKASQGGIIDPDLLLTGFGTQTEGYGKKFLDAVLGPQYAKNYTQFAHVMSEVNEAAGKAGATVRGGTAITGAFLSTVAGVKGAFKGAPGMTGGAAAAIATALFAPAVVQWAVTRPEASKLLIKTAENVAKGRNPMQTARLAGRLLEQSGYAPEDFAASLAPEVPALTQVPQPSWRQPGQQGNWRAPIGPMRRDPSNPIGQTLAPDPTQQLGETSQ